MAQRRSPSAASSSPTRDRTRAGSDLGDDDHRRNHRRRRRRSAYRINAASKWISNGLIADFSTILAATSRGPDVVRRRARDYTRFPAPARPRTSTVCGCPTPPRSSSTMSSCRSTTSPAMFRAKVCPGAAGLRHTSLMVAAHSAVWEALDRAILFQGPHPGRRAAGWQGFTHNAHRPPRRPARGRPRVHGVTTPTRSTAGSADGAVNTEGAIAKYLATEASSTAADAAIQAHGGGYTRPYVVEGPPRCPHHDDL